MQGPIFGEVAADRPGARMSENVAEAVRSNARILPLRLLEGVALEGLERSVKLSAGSVLADRYLLGVHKSEISPAKLFDTCERMGMPAEFLSALKARAEQANAFHFGFEGSGTGGLYKVYLEFAQRLRSEGSAPVLLHLAYKWGALDSAAATIASYTCHPGLSVEAIAQKLASSQTSDTAVTILRLAAARTAVPLMFLEVAEEGNPRASFDLNLHAAGIRIEEARDVLVQAGARYGIPSEQFDALYEGIKHRTLGHLSGGINREGRDFLTVYYAVDRL